MAFWKGKRRRIGSGQEKMKWEGKETEGNGMGIGGRL